VVRASGRGAYHSIIQSIRIVSALAVCALIATCSRDLTPDLCEAAQQGDDELVERLLKRGANPNGKVTLDRTPLHFAADRGHTKIVERLIAAKADVNAKAAQGLTPLMAAASNGHADVVRALLRAKADPNARSQPDGATALMMATANRQILAILALGKGGADMDAATTFGLTSLIIAARNGDAPVALALLNSGADVNRIAEPAIGSALWQAVENRQIAVARLLLDRGAKVDVVALGDTPLIRAIDHHDQTMVALLMEHGAKAPHR
jgi:ankyrin repeat protein